MIAKRLSAVWLLACVAAIACYAETYTPEASNRVTINFGATPWKFIKANPVGASDSGFNDAAWKDVGIPHCMNDSDTFINQQSGGGDGSFYNGPSWYRKHFTLDASYTGRKVFVEFEGAHYAIAAYINGHFLPGNSAYNPKATHVIGFIGCVVDITPYVHFGGVPNVMACYVTKTQDIWSDPHFSGSFRFGQGSGGMFRPVWMHITDPVHVPLNIYSVLNKWGTYVATTAASDAQATVRIQTNVQNEGATDQTVSLTTKIVDATSTVVSSLTSTQTITAGQTYLFDQTATILNPHLWYPNASPYGKPYLHKVYHIVKIGATTVDVFTSPLGIRTITWDANYPYINGHQHFLWGAAGRYDYPALGTAIPEEQQWRDVSLVAACNGRLWRPGHSSCSPEYVAACDEYGVMVVQPSGEGEGAFSTNGLAGYNDPTYTKTLKSELHRDMVIRDRNHPSILAWEASNGPIDPTFCDQLRALAKQWDSLTPHVQAVRGDPFPPGDLAACTMTGCEIGVKAAHPLCPSWGAEAWSRGAARFAYDFEIAHAEQYVQNWKRSIQNKCFGLVQWYLAEECGEDGNFLEGLTGTQVRSIGTAMMDASRIPKLLYKIYTVAWDTTKPAVYLAHHWNRTGSVRVNAFSNCDSVRLSINGVSQGTKARNPWIGTADDQDDGQANITLPFQVHWDNLAWTAGTLKAEGINKAGQVLCTDQKVTAGAPAAVKLTVEPALVRPDGSAFQITANGSDAAFILATVVDANGVWCPTANNDITFAVTAGDVEYRGGTQAYVFNGALTFRSPLDPTLQAEGGLQKIAVKSRFTPGTVTVTASATNLTTGTVSYTIDPAKDIITAAAVPVHAPVLAALPDVRIMAAGGLVRYFISQASDVSVDILNASGKVVLRIPCSRQLSGWHPVQMTGSAKTMGEGVYFVKVVVGGQAMAAKRVVVVK
ncbi:MAG TPA: DUF4982 domain-containing protein [Chitinivibrionales bacterium]|jgi:hypothetical protein|nr:DUF4982 domain-containing protein [Chitinivibrionales bacterium]